MIMYNSLHTNYIDESMDIIIPFQTLKSYLFCTLIFNSLKPEKAPTSQKKEFTRGDCSCEHAQ